MLWSRSISLVYAKTDRIHINMHSGKYHQPVLAEGATSLFSILQPNIGDVIFDATVGTGGHAEAFLQRIGPSGRLYAFDADADNLSIAEERLSPWKAQCTYIHDNFRNCGKYVLPPFNIILADLGFSSLHVDLPERGFSFQSDGPLDLRYDRSQGIAASEWLAMQSEEQLFQVLRNFAEIRAARSLASRMYSTMRRMQVHSTMQLRALIEEFVGYRAAAMMPLIFQALRIAVNDELGALGDFLSLAPAMLTSGGRLGIISFHSLEDRMVKRAFHALCTPIIDEQTGQISQHSKFVPMTKKPLVPSEIEIQMNPRARSAKFRAIRKI